jgi:ferredoxin--NADP+ reductase
LNKILKKEVLSTGIKLLEVEAVEIARKAKPGNFVVIRIDEKGERIPLTITDYDTEKETLTIVFQEVGFSTERLGKLEPGDTLLDVVGPMGKPARIEKFGVVVCVAGGVGIAPVYPITRQLKNAGNKVLSIIGARSHEFLFWEKKMRDVSDEIHVCTDDGSYGRKGFVTDELKAILEKNKKIDLVIAIGPVVMMKAVSSMTKPYGIKTIVSLNPIMVDATGMCGGCRVTVGGKTKFACVDGPEFDGHEVNFDELLSRRQIYLEEERTICKMCPPRVKSHQGRE